MRSKSYKSLQRSIGRGDKSSIETRWEFGHKILADPKKMSASGSSLRNGAIEALIADATAVGSKLSRREIQRRMQCARTYETIAQLRRSAAQFEDWSAFAEAGFPAPEADEIPSAIPAVMRMAPILIELCTGLN